MSDVYQKNNSYIDALMSTNEKQADHIKKLEEALTIASQCLRCIYDPSEDDKNNPVMQSIGKALKKCAALEGK